ncbi:MAG: VWA domain-containing protein [Chitinispirillaceae bacterium]|nr:VWA domain-containing protein [Chitinispirillaceae bacterium]
MMNRYLFTAAVTCLLAVGCSVRNIARDTRVQPIDSNETVSTTAVKQPAAPTKKLPQTPATLPHQSVADRDASRRLMEEKEAVPETRRCEKKAAPRLSRQVKLQKAKALYGSASGIMSAPCLITPAPALPTDFNTEQYSHINENGFKKVTDDPLSTFSIDVDAASYSNVRRFLNSNTLPPADAVRIEEMINYFSYDYPQPTGEHPFSITTETGKCPWDPQHRLVHIGLQGKKIADESLPASNLVFLLDVSGSMNSPDKLPLLKSALKLLVGNLREQDHVAITVYAGNAGLVLPSTRGNEKQTIIAALDRLEAGGSTAGGAGIQLAYATAVEHFIKDGNNRVILATDGDFNVGPSSDGELVRMIEEKRKAGIFLTVLGFGTGNYKDAKMEQLADKGNGNFAYIDNLLEAKKVLVTEMGGTLLTIAKDVKIQIEFNPRQVSAYRLVGYENRLLANQDFNDDKKDAGELGSGHTVTALYEIVPAGVKSDLPSVDPLKYQKHWVKTDRSQRNELLTVKFRYKKPAEEKSRLIQKTVKTTGSDAVSNNFRFSAAVAGFGMLLRGSRYMGSFNYNQVISLARSSKGADLNGYRSECVNLMEKAQLLSEGLSDGR